MGRRYYCDYCDKTFIDDLEARKKHLQSAQHIKLRNLHYETHRDPKTVLIEESKKQPCRRFMQTGICQFSGNCKYTHYSQEQLWELQQQVQYAEYEKRVKKMEPPEVPTVESWLEKYNLKHSSDKDNSDVVNVSWTYPEQLESRSDLPPSLRKFKVEDFVDDHFEEWGV